LCAWPFKSEREIEVQQHWLALSVRQNVGGLSFAMQKPRFVGSATGRQTGRDAIQSTAWT